MYSYVQLLEGVTYNQLNLLLNLIIFTNIKVVNIFWNTLGSRILNYSCVVSITLLFTWTLVTYKNMKSGFDIGLAYSYAIYVWAYQTFLQKDKAFKLSMYLPTKPIQMVKQSKLFRQADLPLLLFSMIVVIDQLSRLLLPSVLWQLNLLGKGWAMLYIIYTNFIVRVSIQPTFFNVLL